MFVSSHAGCLVLVARLSSGETLPTFLSSLWSIHRDKYLFRAKKAARTLLLLFTILIHPQLSPHCRDGASWIPETLWKLLLEPLDCRHLLCISFLWGKQYSYSATVFSNPWIPGPICLGGSLQVCLSILNSCSMNIHGVWLKVEVDLSCGTFFQIPQSSTYLLFVL